MKGDIGRQEHEEYCGKILEKAKSQVKAFVMDVDGTLKGGSDERYKKADIPELLKKIASKGKYPIVITASGVTALKTFLPLEEFYEKEKCEIPVFAGIGNGAAIYCFDKNGRREIYNKKLSLEEERGIIEAWKKVYSSLKIEDSELQQKGIEAFRNFINKDWKGYIPDSFAELFRRHEGKCFTEEVKVTFVLPKWSDDRQRMLIAMMQKEIDDSFGAGRYSASRGDDVYVHVTKNPGIDTKLFAMLEVMKILGLKKREVAAFGDMPFDNDSGILVDSKLEFSFTNYYFEKRINEPPFILPGSEESAVGSVHMAIEYLLD